MRRALLSVGASASAISCAALAGQSRAAQAAGAEDESSSQPKYGFEGHKVNYGGAGDVKPSNREATKRIVSHMSTVPDEWELFRIATRASLILDKLNEADADIAKRPETLKVKTLEGVDLSRMVYDHSKLGHARREADHVIQLVWSYRHRVLETAMYRKHVR